MKTKFDIATVVTQRILHSIETGEFSKFTQSWSTRQASHPVNFLTGKPYSGVNVWLLGMTEFSRNEWLTKKQAATLGATVREGEEPTMACFYKMNASTKKDADGNSTFYPLLRYFNAYNVEQFSGLILPELPELPKPSGSEMAVFLRQRAEDLKIGLKHQGDSAFYSRVTDCVTMPSTAFVSDAAYSSVLAHELIHATGSANRLNRKKGEKFGDSDYALEELVAELGSAFLCAQFGISNTYGLQHESYLASWLKALGNDNKAFFKASTAADKAFKLLSGKVSDEVQSEIETS